MTATSVGLRWNLPELPNGILLRYIVKYSNGSMVGDMPYTQEVNAGLLSANVTNLMNNTNYTFAIVAENGAGNSTCSSEITIETPGMYIHVCIHTCQHYVGMVVCVVDMVLMCILVFWWVGNRWVDQRSTALIYVCTHICRIAHASQIYVTAQVTRQVSLFWIS